MNTLKKRIKISFISIAALFISLFNLSCTQLEKAQNHSRNIIEIETALPTALLTFDPGRVMDIYSKRVLIQIYEGLVEFSEDNKLKPKLAEKFESSEDSKIYYFYIRKGVKFHNGQELDAYDVKFSFERACGLPLSSPIAEPFFKDVVGAEDKLSGKTKDISGIKVLDKYKIQITLKRPIVYFLDKMAFAGAFILPKDKVPLTEIIKREDAIGTGPYKFSEFHKEQMVVLRAHEDYWGHKANIPEIKIQIVKDQMTNINQYKAGRYDFSSVAPLETPNLKKDPVYKTQLVFKDRSATYYLELNPKIYAPFKHAKVRQAFAMAINQQYIVEKLLYSTAQTSTGIVGKNIPGYPQTKAKLTYNPFVARKLIRRAGYHSRKPLPHLELTIAAKLPLGLITAEAIAIQLKKNLGVHVSVKELEWGAYIEKLNKKVHAFVMKSWSADYPNPANFLTDLFMSNSLLNHCNYSNPKYDALCLKADRLDNEQKRMVLYAQAEDILLEDAQVIPLFHPEDCWLVRGYVQGLRFNFNGLMQFNTLTISDKK